MWQISVGLAIFKLNHGGLLRELSCDSHTVLYSSLWLTIMYHPNPSWKTPFERHHILYQLHDLHILVIVPVYLQWPVLLGAIQGSFIQRAIHINYVSWVFDSKQLFIPPPRCPSSQWEAGTCLWPKSGWAESAREGSTEATLTKPGKSQGTTKAKYSIRENNVARDFENWR